MGLFRQQALDASRDRLHGHVMLLPRAPHTLLCLFLLVWVALVVTFLCQSTYSRKETVVGWLEPADGMVRVYTHGEGKLAQLLVSEGDEVVAGQPMAVINGDHILPDGQHLEAVLLAEYALQKEALERQLQRERALQEVRMAELAERRRGVEQEILALTEQSDTLRKRSALTEKRIERHTQLATQGYITESELDMLVEQHLQLNSEQLSLSAQQARQEALSQQLRAQELRLPDESANTIDSLQLQLSDLSQQIARLRGNRAYVVQASISGRVSNIRLQEGQKTSRDQPLLNLLPSNTELIAYLLVPVRAAGFIESGQAVLMRYDAYPYQKFGFQRGEVIAVATSASLPGELSHSPFSIAEPVYRVTARPSTDRISAYGGLFELKTGMTLSADIQLEQRSLLQWLLEPLFSLRGRLT